MWSSRTTRRRAAERGFVLATTLLVTTLLTVMLAASFILVSAEQRTTLNSFDTARALALAQAGLQNYFSQDRRLTDSSAYDSTRIALVTGYADVVARKVRASGATVGSPLALWIVRSTGVSTSPVLTGQVAGTRTIAQFAQLNPGILPARAAIVALNGVQVSGSGGKDNPLTGYDSTGSVSPCVAPSHPTDDTAAVSAPTTILVDPDNGYHQTKGGDPDGTVETAPFATWNSLYNATHIDWSALLGGNFRPDYMVTNASPVSAWPPAGNTNYPVVYVPKDGSGNPQDIQIPAGVRRGMLVVTGNVLLQGSSQASVEWDGIILAGGNLSVPNAGPGWQYLRGMVVTGLNVALGQSVPRTSLTRATSNQQHDQPLAYVQWAWCYTHSSIGTFSALVPVKNGWADTWTTY